MLASDGGTRRWRWAPSSSTTMSCCPGRICSCPWKNRVDTQGPERVLEDLQQPVNCDHRKAIKPRFLIQYNRLEAIPTSSKEFRWGCWRSVVVAMPGERRPTPCLGQNIGRKWRASTQLLRARLDWWKRNLIWVVYYMIYEFQFSWHHQAAMVFGFWMFLLLHVDQGPINRKSEILGLRFLVGFVAH